MNLAYNYNHSLQFLIKNCSFHVELSGEYIFN